MFKIGHFFAGFKKSLHFYNLTHRLCRGRRPRRPLFNVNFVVFLSRKILLYANVEPSCFPGRRGRRPLRSLCHLPKYSAFSAHFPQNLKINIIYINFHLRVISIKIIHFSPKACSFTDILQNHTRTLFCLDIYFVKLLDFCYKI
jgi:hypothetical protein